MAYIRTPRVYEKLKKAEETYRPVIMMAPFGSGKTSAVRHYFRRKSPLYLNCENGSITEMPRIDSIRTGIIVVDDLESLSEEKGISYLKELLQDEGRLVVLLTRGEFPKYLTSEDLDFIRIREKDFLLGEEEIRQLFSEMEIDTEPEIISKIAVLSKGYPYAVKSYATRLESGEPFSEAMGAAVWHDLFEIWDENVYEEWGQDFQEFGLSLCRYDSFSPDMAVMLTGNQKARETLEFCRSHTSQLIYLPGDHYRLREEIRRFFCWKQELMWPKERILENYRKAASCYELEGDIQNALKFYSLSGAHESVKAILVKEMMDHPGTGHYIETKDYYFELPREEVLESPLLMAGMSMLCDLMILPKESEEWYEALSSYEKDRKNPRSLRKEARARLAYLDIALPHRGTRGILRIMKNVFTLVSSGELELPEMSVTGNLPSVMNGGLDFSEWSKSDTQIARFMKRPLEIILGRYGPGLVTVALAESGFEKGTMDPYEVLTRCNNGYEAASHGGKIEMCFAAIGILTRQHILAGQLPSAKRRFATFREKAAFEQADWLKPNMEAFAAWMELFTGNDGRDYVECTMDELSEFHILERYRSMVKLRCLIAEERYSEAMDLSDFLGGYFSSYERYFFWMENEVLKSIVLYRMGVPQWSMHLKRGLEKAAEYHFVRLIALEGAAVLPLIRILEKDGELSELPQEYLTQLLSETERMAQYYPDYMKYIPKEQVYLTKRETQILSLLCRGLRTEEICEECGISYSGLKKHNRNIYQKLGARDRAEAERRALQLGLVYHGSE